MPFNELLQSMELSADEKIKEILENARFSAEEILNVVTNDSKKIRDDLKAQSVEQVNVERNRSLYLLKEEIKGDLAKEKERIFQEVFSRAEQLLGSCRKDPRYRESFLKMLNESLSDASGRIIIHIDPVDLEIYTHCMNQIGSLKAEISPDLNCAGGLNVALPDERINVYNTVESRLKKSRIVLRKEVFSFLFGD
ncbi:MAG TPA: V-type ATP synthase subunit E [Methanoregulaceae archaeon]|nr:V-type ATP synthase subunit E [Methanoregulaceae archaeon]